MNFKLTFGDNLLSYTHNKSAQEIQIEGLQLENQKHYLYSHSKSFLEPIEERIDLYVQDGTKAFKILKDLGYEMDTTEDEDWFVFYCPFETDFKTYNNFLNLLLA